MIQEHAGEEATNQNFGCLQNQTSACSMYKKMLIVMMQSGIFSMQLYDCISQSTFVSMSLNDLIMCGHSIVQPSKAGACGRRV
jgi:hypothetical protein